jgi:hypothetical protein
MPVFGVECESTDLHRMVLLGLERARISYFTGPRVRVSVKRVVYSSPITPADRKCGEQSGEPALSEVECGCG